MPATLNGRDERVAVLLELGLDHDRIVSIVGRLMAAWVDDVVSSGALGHTERRSRREMQGLTKTSRTCSKLDRYSCSIWQPSDLKQGHKRRAVSEGTKKRIALDQTRAHLFEYRSCKTGGGERGSGSTSASAELLGRTIQEKRLTAAIAPRSRARVKMSERAGTRTGIGSARVSECQGRPPGCSVPAEGDVGGELTVLVRHDGRVAVARDERDPRCVGRVIVLDHVLPVQVR